LTALHKIVKRGLFDIVNILVESGADVTVQTDVILIILLKTMTIIIISLINVIEGMDSTP